MSLGPEFSKDRVLCSRIMQAGLSLLLCCSFAGSTRSQQPQGPLTNEAIVKLAQAGFKEKTLIAIIHTRPNQFKLGTEELIELKRKGISENVIMAMLSQDDSFDFAEDDWGGDGSVLRGANRTPTSGQLQESDSTSIFGSGGSSRAQTRSRSGNGASENEGNLTGSATVRILRSPTEGGASALKLEKTPTLDNDAVARLVEAGFSEGTIIKRIEQSPSDFDLSPSRLEELRRRRVTEPIISAMIAAMGSETKPANKR